MDIHTVDTEYWYIGILHWDYSTQFAALDLYR